MKERTILAIFGLAIFGLSFLMAIATAGLPDLDPADDILAEDIPQLPDDLFELESHELDVPRDGPALVCYDLPTPQLIFTGKEDYSTADGQFTRYKLSVTNWAEYPEAFFQPAPDLPPCGSNANGARAWVNIWAEGGAYIYSFCALASPSELQDLWFALPRGEAPPEEIYITINDRRCGDVLQSNFLTITAEPASICYSDLPAPQLAITGSEDYSTADGQFTRYNLAVTNRADYPAELFQPAPDLPPCGSNANSARSWVNIYDGSGNYLYGFCALSSPADLEDLWFAIRRGETPPRSAYITIEDRKCGNTYRSNEVSISRIPGTPGSSLSAPVQVSPADGSTFGHYPRSTTLQWSPVAGAATYTVEIDCYHSCVSNRWCTDVGSQWSIVPGITGTSYTFDFVGKQSGRWRVWAVKANGEEGPKSGWWTFEYTT